MQSALFTPAQAPAQLAETAPLPAALRAQFLRDCGSVRALKEAANRHGDAVLEDWDARNEFDAAREHFELGCWLAWYAARVYRPEALQDRIECAARILRSGIRDIGYKFYTVFRFGERHYDTCFEMGDADDVVAGLYALAETDPKLAAGLAKSGIRPRV